MSTTKLTTAAGCPVVDNQNVMTAGPRGPPLLPDVWFLEKLAHFHPAVLPEPRMHTKGPRAYRPFPVTHGLQNAPRPEPAKPRSDPAPGRVAAAPRKACRMPSPTAPPASRSERPSPIAPNRDWTPQPRLRC